jgi:hypothetical protein
LESRFSTVNSRGKKIFAAAVLQGEIGRFIVRADEKLTPFMELESAIRACSVLS